MNPDSHITDQEIVLAADGELGSARAAQVSKHLERCWSCRARKAELEAAVAELVRIYDDSHPPIPPPTGPRALLRARLSAAAAESPRSTQWTRWFAWKGIAAGCALAVLLIVTNVGYHEWKWGSRSFHTQTAILPEPGLTPGAVVRLDREQVCSADFPRNRAVPVALQRRVFEEYGISGAPSNAYEVDYLITPALGGADDIHNLWPQSYSSTVWNAHVKDALEDRLKDLVCRGDIDLAEAQREIASDWIAAYKKYFHTDRPLEREP
jgi:hypothetical protein